MIKTKQPKKFGVTKARSLKENSKNYVVNDTSSNTILTVKKNSAFAERNIRSLENIIYKYLILNGLTVILKKLPSFVQTINSRVKRVTKLARNNVPRNHVPVLVSLIANSSSKLVQKPTFYVGHYVRIAKTDSPFRKGYKQNFTHKVFEIVAVPTENPPTYSLIDAEKAEISRKCYERELRLIGNKADYN